MNPSKAPSSSWALILIAVALAGAGVSYHFTLESRFASIEQKLDQNSIALQQYQISQETTLSSKMDALNNLGQEVDALQTSLAPLGKATREQTDSLTDIRKQVASLQLSQQAQIDTQKKLSDYASQIEKIKHDIQAQAQVPAPAATISTPVPAPLMTPLPMSHASAANLPLPLPPRADNAVDLRPDDTVLTEIHSVRALPVALPVSLSVSDSR
jgi:predicted phage tail protein